MSVDMVLVHTEILYINYNTVVEPAVGLSKQSRLGKDGQILQNVAWRAHAKSMKNYQNR